MRILGPLQVEIDGAPVEIRGRIQRALLGRLAIAQGQVDSTGRLVDDIWEGEPPPSAVSVLQVQIHNLRRVFEPQRARRAPAAVLVSEPHGYALRLAAEDVDAWHFEALLAEYEKRVRELADEFDAVRRCDLLDVALACWRGPALESFPDARWGEAEVARLTDLRLLAAELRARAALELDRSTEVVTGLRPQVEQYPQREESARLLATAQYRLGQQTDALATLRRAREFLIREMGVNPGRRLQELETAILTQSDALER
ncbi:AfsR/SARP family transcriptional regulator [Nocardia crassostreae]|uniref:AfsR/SARP family transcriptional regulator n=1 Tax=Nocardia crassostreae TaxID=53428 RepID=UPI0008339520|nr:BTAD domain-containing putative transcriptional regulator [Nocardia crassostreae]